MSFPPKPITLRAVVVQCGAPFFDFDRDSLRQFMENRFQERNLKVVIIDPSAPVRQLLSDVMRGLGFEGIQAQPSIHDTLSFMEVEEVDWIIAPLMPDQDVNAMHLIKICTEHPALKTTRVSLLLEEEERYVIPAAAEFGMFSWHNKPFTKDSLTEELGELLKTVESVGWDETLCAAKYLRDYLSAQNLHEAMVSLEKSLLTIHPGDPELLVKLGRAQAKSNLDEAAKATLLQAKALAPDRAEEIKELGKELFGESGLKLNGSEGENHNILGIEKGVVIDPDIAIGNSVSEILKELGVADVEVYTDGDEAWEGLKKGEPGVIIHEWRIPKVPGPLLIQKIRNEGFLGVPLIVLSSLIKPEDIPLVKEMGVAKTVEKPLEKEQFMKGLIGTIQEERAPTEGAAMERKIRSLIGLKKMDEAKELINQFCANENIPVGKKRLIEAELAFIEKQYEEARDFGIEALKLSGDTVLLMNLLGKVFMQLRDFDSSLKCFKKAQELSPQNIERLCAMAEVQTEMGDAEGAQEALATAENIDGDSKLVKESKIKVAIASGDSDMAKQVMSELDTLSDVVGYMNNKAVAHARCGYTDEAIDMYKKTIKSIPEKDQKTIAIVTYNLALAAIRAGDYETGSSTLEKIISMGNSPVAKKTHSLKLRLDKALEKGGTFILKGDEKEIKQDAGAVKEAEEPANKDGSTAEEPKGKAAKSPADYAQMIAKVEAKKGEICCYLIYNHPGERDAKITAFLTNPPRFKHRKAIERNESMGAERAQRRAG